MRKRNIAPGLPGLQGRIVAGDLLHLPTKGRQKRSERDPPGRGIGGQPGGEIIVGQVEFPHRVGELREVLDDPAPGEKSGEPADPGNVDKPGRAVGLTVEEVAQIKIAMVKACRVKLGRERGGGREHVCEFSTISEIRLRGHVTLCSEIFRGGDGLPRRELAMGGEDERRNLVSSQQPGRGEFESGFGGALGGEVSLEMKPALRRVEGGVLPVGKRAPDRKPRVLTQQHLYAVQPQRG